MSNEMVLGKVKFHIPREQEQAATEALRTAAREVVEKRDMRAGDIEETGREIDELTLDELVRCWGWELVRDIANEADEIIDIDLVDDFSSDEENLFETLGPFVTAGSYVDLSGKRLGEYWQTRYGFTGKRMVELEGVFPPVPIEV